MQSNTATGAPEGAETRTPDPESTGRPAGPQRAPRGSQADHLGRLVEALGPEERATFDHFQWLAGWARGQILALKVELEGAEGGMFTLAQMAQARLQRQAERPVEESAN